MNEAATCQHGQEAFRRFCLFFALVLLLVATGCTSGTSDEPPIRVKNGTMELWLLSHSDGWIRDGNSRNWKLHGRRTKDDLDIMIAVGSGATCTAPLDRSGRKLEVHYSDSTEVDLQSTGNHTKVTASKDLTMRDGAPQLLTYGGPTDYISSIVMDGKTICTFTAADQLHSLVVLDY